MGNQGRRRTAAVGLTTDISPRIITLKAEHPLAILPVISERAAEQSATQTKMAISETAGFNEMEQAD